MGSEARHSCYWYYVSPKSNNAALGSAGREYVRVCVRGGGEQAKGGMVGEWARKRQLHDTERGVLYNEV